MASIYHRSGPRRWFMRKNTGKTVWHFERNGLSLCGKTQPFPGMPRSWNMPYTHVCLDCLKVPS